MNRLVETQIAAGAWGVRRVIEACESLTAEQFTQPHDIGPPPGSLQGTLAHIVESMFYFADNFAGREYVEPPHFAALQHTPSGLRDLLSEAETAMRSAIGAFLSASGEDLAAPVYWSGMRRDIPAALGLAQAFDHATHHRVQCMHMLKKLGVTPLAETHPLEWPGPPGPAGPA